MKLHVAASGEPVATAGRETPEEPLNGLMELFLVFGCLDLGGLSSKGGACGFSFWELEHVDLTKGSWFGVGLCQKII